MWIIVLVAALLLAVLVWNWTNIISPPRQLPEQTKTEPDLTFLLMGKTGHGKSAAGNSILNSTQFETSPDGISMTKEVQNGFREFGNCTLMVIDGPGLEDTAMDKVQNTEAAVKNMTIALAMCYGGVDAFLFVYKFRTRFTAEEKSALEALKRIFGPTYMDHVIVVITCGDLYQSAVSNGECYRNFHQWCRQQTGDFRQLYEDCNGRFVLFNNGEKDERKKWIQVKKLVQLTQDLRDEYGRYTSQCFMDAEKERKKLIAEMKAPQLILGIQKSISLLCADIDRLSKQPSESEKERIKSRIQHLMQEIDVHDEGTGRLAQLRRDVEQAITYLDDVKKLQRLAIHLKHVRLARQIWQMIGTFLTVLGGVVTLIFCPAGKIVSLAADAVAGAGELAFGTAEGVLEEKRNKLRRRQTSATS